MREVRGRQIGMVFQEAMTSLNPLATVGNQIAEVLTIHGQMTGSAAPRPRRCGCSSASGSRRPRRALNDLPHSLSGGMRQRVMIAMALACRPQLLIADEPTTALDVTIQAQILALIKELQHEEGMGVLFITHDMGVVAEIADRTVVMLGGEVVEAGPTEAIFADGAEPLHQEPDRRRAAARHDAGEWPAAALPDRSTATTGMLKAAAERARYRRPRRPPGARGAQPRQALRHGERASSARSPAGCTRSRTSPSTCTPGRRCRWSASSGCGKSTTGRAIMRLVEPQAGSILLDGTDILALDKSRMRDMRRHIQMIFQDPFASLNPRIRVGDAIAEPYLTHRLGTRAQARAKVADLLQQVGLDPGDREPLSAAVLRRPAPAHLHRPGAGARAQGDRRRRVGVRRSTSRSRRRWSTCCSTCSSRFGLSYLFISHDMAVVERMSHQVAVMYLGEIVEIGPASAVFNDPQHPYTKRLIAAVPVPDPARRTELRPVANDEVKSPIRPIDFVPPKRSYRTVSEGHVVQEWESDWRV